MLLTVEQIQSHIALKNHPQKVEIVAVSKLQSTEKIINLHNSGQKIFAENYAQELSEKQQQLVHLNLRWHFIGKIQTNKLKQVVGKCELIHSVDSIDHAKKINQLAEHLNVQQNILWQLNLADELSKSGSSIEQLENNISALQQLKNIQLTGLMTMPPLSEDPEPSRKYFQQLKSLRDSIRTHITTCEHLSMGTTSDWKIAVEEGATLIRLGTVLFGERNI